MSQAVDARKAWLMVVLLFFFMFINFSDKLVIGVSAVPLMRDLGITPGQFGLVGSSFFILFALSAVITGFVLNRVKTKWVLAVLALVWALTQLPMLGTVSLGTLVACRMVLGAAEGPATPTSIHSLYKWFDNESRTFPAAIMNSLGASAGIFVAAPLLTWIIAAYSWHAAFGTLAVIGFVWVALWLVLGEEGPVKDPPLPATTGLQAWPRIPYLRMLLGPTFLAICCCGFMAYWSITLLVVWAPAFLVKAQGYSPGEAAWSVSLVSACSGAASIGVAGLSQMFIRWGTTSRKARALPNACSILLCGAATCAMTMVAPGPLQLLLFVVAFTASAPVYPLSYAMIAEFVPIEQRGAALSIFTGVMTTAGFASPAVMGFAVQWGATPGAGFSNGFIIAGVLAMIAGLVGVLAINPEAERLRLAVLARNTDGAIDTSALGHRPTISG